MSAHLEIVDAFMDGESVDPAGLKQALATPEGRDYLVDGLALREVVDADPTAAVVPLQPRARHRWLAAAAALVLVATGGYYAGTASQPSPSARAATADAPAATRVIQLEPGINWFESIGGN